MNTSEDIAYVISCLKTQADSNSWEEREDAGFRLRDILENDFDKGFELTESWVFDSSPRVRRAVCLACMQRKKLANNTRVMRVLGRLSHLMMDDDEYVRRCCGPYVVGYLGYTYPSLTLPWLYEQASSADLNVRANVAKAFSQALGGRHPSEAVEILFRLANDDRRRIKLAVISSVRNVYRRSTEGAELVRKKFNPSFYSVKG